LVIAIINLSDPSALTAGIAAVIPVVFGSVTTWLKIFIDPQKDFRARIDLKKKDLLERVAMDHAVLLNHCRAIDEDTLLRGDGYNEPDLVGNYTRRVFKLFAILHRLETLKLVVKVAYWLLIWCLTRAERSCFGTEWEQCSWNSRSLVPYSRRHRDLTSMRKSSR